VSKCGKNLTNEIDILPGQAVNFTHSAHGQHYGPKIIFGIRYISNKSKAELKEFCEKKGIHFYQGLKSTRFDTPFIRKNIKEFINFMDPLILSVDTFAPSELLKLLRNNLDYDRFILDEDNPSSLEFLI